MKKRMHYVIDCLPRNKTRFGKKMAKAARVMHDSFFYKKHFYGFQDGGCHMFASALEEWSKGVFDIFEIRRERGEVLADHVLAHYQYKNLQIFIDSEGMMTDNDLILKWKALYSNTSFIKKSTKYSLQNIDYFPEAVEKLVKGLHEHLGPFNIDELNRELDEWNR